MRELRSRKRIWFFVFVRQGPYYVAQAGPKSYLPASLTEGIGLQVYVITPCYYQFLTFISTIPGCIRLSTLVLSSVK